MAGSSDPYDKMGRRCLNRSPRPVSEAGRRRVPGTLSTALRTKGLSRRCHTEDGARALHVHVRILSRPCLPAAPLQHHKPTDNIVESHDWTARGNTMMFGPNAKEENISKALALFEAGEFEQASGLLQPLLARFPNDPRITYVLGLISIRTGRFQSAVAFISKCLEAAPGNFAPYCDLGEALLALGRVNEAYRAYQRSLTLNPHNPRAKKGAWVARKGLGEAGDYRSSAGQDEFVHKSFFRDRREGVFLDIGAYDGITGSNTYFFERNLEWTGVCFEPSPGQFQRLIQNRTARCINACLSNYDGEAQFLDVIEGLTMMGGLIENYDRQALDMLHTRAGQQLEHRTVKVMRLSSFLKDACITDIDYCSIDVEGSEMNILRDLDFGLTRIEVFSVENNHENNHDIKDFLEAVGYLFVDKVGADEIYRRRPEGR